MLLFFFNLTSQMDICTSQQMKLVPLNIFPVEEIVPSTADINLVRRKGEGWIFLLCVCVLHTKSTRLIFFSSNRGISASSG